MAIQFPRKGWYVSKRSTPGMYYDKVIFFPEASVAYSLYVVLLCRATQELYVSRVDNPHTEDAREDFGPVPDLRSARALAESFVLLDH